MVRQAWTEDSDEDFDEANVRRLKEHLVVLRDSCLMATIVLVVGVVVVVAAAVGSGGGGGAGVGGAGIK